MKCLGVCENATLNYFMGAGDQGMCIYQIAEDLAPKHKAGEVSDACSVLEHIGLIRNIGTTTKVFKLSSPALGDVRKGFFNPKGGDVSKELLELRAQLMEIEENQITAAREAAALPPAGGLAQDKK